MFARMSSWNLNMTRWRVVTGVPRHPGKAVRAASTAALNSSAVVSGIRDTTSCVACDSPDTQMGASHTHSPRNRSARNQNRFGGKESGGLRGW